MPADGTGVDVEEMARAARVGERLAAELRATIDLLPAQSRRPVGVSRELGVDRGTAARAVRTARREGASAAIEALMHAPGVEGLRKIIEAGRERRLPKQSLDALERAVEAYAELIGEMGGSQAQLNARLEHMRASANGAPPAAGASDERQRRRLYEASAAIVGRSCDVRTEVILTRPSPQRPGELERFWARGVIGYRAEADAMPLVIGAAESGVVRDDGGESDEISALTAQIRAAVAEPFTSSPPPIVTRRGPENQAILAIDAAAAATHERADVMLVSEAPDKVADVNGEPIERDEIRTIVRNPTSALLFDVYVHASLAADRVPAVGVYLWSPAFQRDVSSHWYDRLPHPPVLQLLGRGLSNAASDAYESQGDLAAFCFDRAGWTAAEFVGFRFAVRYPVWGGCYCMRFRYGEE